MFNIIYYFIKHFILQQGLNFKTSNYIVQGAVLSLTAISAKLPLHGYYTGMTRIYGSCKLISLMGSIYITNTYIKHIYKTHILIPIAKSIYLN